MNQPIPNSVRRMTGGMALAEMLKHTDCGAKFGKVRQGDEFCLCDGKDPDGNPVQLSDR
mgnify:CR=1 FL=1